MEASKNRPVILASASPRRKELLAQLLDDFSIVPADVDEDALTVSDPWETATNLALAKARAVRGIHPEALVIGGDTVVALAENRGHVQLTKPIDKDDAERILRRLSGKTHVVITGVALVQPGLEKTFSETTRVKFRNLSDAEISAYVATGEPMDKAGAYAIQAGAEPFVLRVEGSLSNVIGLPLEELRRQLQML